MSTDDPLTPFRRPERDRRPTVFVVGATHADADRWIKSENLEPERTRVIAAADGFFYGDGFTFRASDVLAFTPGWDSAVGIRAQVCAIRREIRRAVEKARIMPQLVGVSAQERALLARDVAGRAA
jgi:triacylglycerol esterase/lipase EstA (alpha/beta hydrolase family)